jgi:hypothetical protein
MRPIKSAKLKQTRFPRVAIALRLAGFLLLLPGHLLSAQYVPIVSGAVGFFDSKNTGINFFQTCCNQPGRACVSGQLRPLPQSTRTTLTPNHWNGAPSYAGTSFAQPAGRARHPEISEPLNL